MLGPNRITEQLPHRTWTCEMVQTLGGMSNMDGAWRVSDSIKAPTLAASGGEWSAQDTPNHRGIIEYAMTVPPTENSD